MPQGRFQALHSTLTGDAWYKYRKINSFAIQLPFFMIKPIVSRFRDHLLGFCTVLCQPPSPAAEASADSSTTIYFSRTQPEGVKWRNWIQTMSGKNWFTLLRLCSPLDPFFHKSLAS